MLCVTWRVPFPCPLAFPNPEDYPTKCGVCQRADCRCRSDSVTELISLNRMMERLRRVGPTHPNPHCPISHTLLHTNPTPPHHPTPTPSTLHSPSESYPAPLHSSSTHVQFAAHLQLVVPPLSLERPPSERPSSGLQPAAIAASRTPRHAQHLQMIRQVLAFFSNQRAFNLFVSA